ncbi:hypothetical protein J2W49_000940 [Hydrogenophaga palleronii]|uniref:Uncharacterized protein n=1 Tax=Hydrogenophaga palleronii TaxID=65655 RepID=A0ABU1WI97_9BURK|nr:hypothetical protein [Hydrogenophaga palleronii]MDR7148991.1 hypothetical protein [Hydrogenophaga palleronii]
MTTQTGVHLARAGIPGFVDQRHTVGQYPTAEVGSVMRGLLDQTLAQPILLGEHTIFY